MTTALAGLTDLTQFTGAYTIDPAHSQIGFVARHAMATRVPGHFQEFTGRAHLDGDDPSKSTVELTIQAATVQTRNQGRDKAVRDKFLDAAGHPAITFVSTSVDQVDAGRFRVTGDLTIRGTTKPVAVELTLTSAGQDRIFLAGTTTIDRKDWGAHWSAVGFLVSRQVVVELDVCAIRRP